MISTMIRFVTTFLLALLVLACPTHAASDAPSAQPTVRVVDDPEFGGQIVTYSAGSEAAPLVVLIHGLGNAGAGDWQLVIPVLAEHYRVLALDLPGFARSSKGNHRYGPSELARAVRGVVGQFTDERFILVGHSMGAAVSLAYADNFPGDLSRLVLVSMAGVLHPAVYTESLSRLGIREITGVDAATNPWAELGIALATELLMERAARLDVDPAILLQTFWMRQAGMRGQPAAIAALALAVHDFGEALRRLETPTVLIWGADDEVAPLRTARVATALIADAHLTVMEQVGHVPMSEAPERFNALLISALAGEIEALPPAIEGERAAAEEEVTCQGRKQARYTGRIDHLIISGCDHVLVENAELQRISIDGGRLELVDSVVSQGITARNARLVLTAGSVAGEPPLMIENTTVDAAGTRFFTNGFVVENRGELPVTLWLSVSSRLDRGARERLVHDVVRVHDRW
jgi:pimeloyl-ACP methyl ester carboxylesterase